LVWEEGGGDSSPVPPGSAGDRISEEKEVIWKRYQGQGMHWSSTTTELDTKEEGVWEQCLLLIQALPEPGANG